MKMNLRGGGAREPPAAHGLSVLGLVLWFTVSFYVYSLANKAWAAHAAQEKFGGLPSMYITARVA